MSIKAYWHITIYVPSSYMITCCYEVKLHKLGNTGVAKRCRLSFGWPIAPSYMSPNAGRGVAGSQPMSTAVHMEGTRINFGDLTPYLTYGEHPENIEWFLEDQAFLGSSNMIRFLAHPLTPPPGIKLSLSSCVSPVELADGRGGGGGGLGVVEPNHTAARTPCRL